MAGSFVGSQKKKKLLMIINWLVNLIYPPDAKAVSFQHHTCKQPLPQFFLAYGFTDGKTLIQGLVTEEVYSLNPFPMGPYIFTTPRHVMNDVMHEFGPRTD